MQGNILFPETYKAYNKAFYEAMIGPLKVEQDFQDFTNTDYWEKYMLNAFQFSAAKSVSELKTLQSLVFGKNGEKISFDEYKDQALKVVSQFNEQWLRVEYDMASRGAVMAEKWQSMWKDRDLYPNYIFRTRKDNRVRPEHAELEGKVFKLESAQGQEFYPPLDWNCRCTVEQTDEGTPLTADEAAKYRDNIGPGFEGNVGIDGILPITKSGSSYFQALKNANEAKPGMFEDKPVAEMPKTGLSIEEAKTEMAKMNISDAERQAILDYTGEKFNAINGYYRGWKKEISEENKKIADTLSDFIKKSPKVSATTYRGISLNEYTVDKFIASLKKGDNFGDAGFMSTSYDKNQALKFGTSDRVKCLVQIEGKNGVLIENLSDVKMEKEILFNRESELIVKDFKIKQSKNGIFTEIFVTLKEN